MSKLYNLLELIVSKVNTATSGLANSQPRGDYALKSDIPTKVSQLTNDSGYLTATNSGGNVDLAGYATKQYVEDYAQPKGDYLTEEDYPEIVDYVIQHLPVYDGEVVPA